MPHAPAVNSAGWDGELQPTPDLLGRAIRLTVLEQSKRANVGHIGSALSVADMVGAVFTAIGAPDLLNHDRDRFVLSKGHAALALYAALAEMGLLSVEDLSTFCTDDSLLGVHPEHSLGGVEFSTGSLGQGMSLAVGAALAASMQRSTRRIIALLSDAECNEGVVWEAAMFAAHHRLENLTVMIDYNRQQAFGYTAEVLVCEDMAARWAAFGWDVVTMNGHDEAAMATVLGSPPTGRPRAIVAETTFGKGVSYMEGQIKWHYLPMTDAEYAQALREIGEM